MTARLLALVILLGAMFPRVAADDSVASYETDTVRFTPRQLIAPAALITVGSLGVSLKPFKQARTWVNNEIGVHKCGPYDDIMQYIPGAAYLFLDFTGIKARKPFVDRVIVGATGLILMEALVHGTKHIVNEPRPSGDHHSFPSGHTAAAFLGAELLRQDYGPWVGAVGYTMASAVGVMRILNGRHWLNDVLAGAGIGILCARAGEWLLPFNRRWLGLDRRRGQAAVIVPTVSTSSASLTALVVF